MKPKNNAAIWLVMAVLMVFAFSALQGTPTQTVPEISYSQFLSEVESGSVSNVTIQGQRVLGSYGDGGAFRTFAPEGADLVAPLTKNRVAIKAAPGSRCRMITQSRHGPVG